MKRIILILITVFIYSTSFCQSNINIETASSHYGQKVTVCSKVYGTKALEKLTFLNLGGKYPNSLLTVVIFTKDKANFKTPPEDLYADKNICVTGVVKEYNSKPEIIVTSPDQITIQ